ncbi:MAG: uracil-DNA glycosylase [Nitrospira bacterium SG8_35_4]|nr:MAG: uracil-DNA glycosylase [Nitrospira bacterium SG8_35_4]
MKRSRVSCYKCIYYFVTWDEKFPRGCRAMNFKSKHMPSTVVFRSSGMDCMGFKAKKVKKPG